MLVYIYIVGGEEGRTPGGGGGGVIGLYKKAPPERGMFLRI